MRILLNEMKKIWNWKILAIIGVICVMFYVLFMSYYVDNYRTGNHPHAEEIYYTEELTRLYGTSITEEQFAEFITEERTALIEQAESYITSMPIFAEAGISSYSDYVMMRENSIEKQNTQAENDAERTLFGKECEFLGFKTQTIDGMEERFGHIKTLDDSPYSFYYSLNEREQRRFQETIENEEHLSIFNSWTEFCTNEYIVRLSVLIILAVLVLVSPLITNDRHKNIHYLQYSSEQGRKIMRVQLIAALLSAFMLTTLLLSVFAGIFSQNGAYVFWDNNLNSAFVGIHTVYNLTYGEWVIISILLMYALALAVSMLAFILSRFSGNLITLTMKLIPTFAVLTYFSVSIFNVFLGMGNTLYILLRIFGTEMYVCVAVAAIALTTAVFVIRREKRVDVV